MIVGLILASDLPRLESGRLRRLPELLDARRDRLRRERVHVLAIVVVSLLAVLAAVAAAIHFGSRLPHV